MSEKRFTIEESENQLIIFDNGVSDETYFHLGNDERDVKYVCDLLNEQQELIEELQEENKQLKLTLSEYGVDLKAFEIFKQKIGYYDKVIDDE